MEIWYEIIVHLEQIEREGQICFSLQNLLGLPKTLQGLTDAIRFRLPRLRYWRRPTREV